MDDWRLEKSAGQCVKTGRAFELGESFYVVLYAEGDGFRRGEYSEAAWTGQPEDAFCFFKSRMPDAEPDKKKRLFVDDEALIDFFIRLEPEKELLRLQFRFVLALILMRKRLLKYEESRHDGEQEIWQVRLTRDKKLHDVVNPRLNDDEIQSVSRQLGEILHADQGPFIDDEIDGHDAASAGAT